jgi:hypothetical protein
MENSDFLKAYIECALWSSRGDESDIFEFFDEEYSSENLAPETLAEMEKDCSMFLDTNDHLINGDYRRAGHDFWLTRNGHGAGFWDGDWPEPEATQLTNAAKEFSEVNLYIGSNGQIYQE